MADAEQPRSPETPGSASTSGPASASGSGPSSSPLLGPPAPPAGAPPLPATRTAERIPLGVELALDPRVVPFWLLSSTFGTLFLSVLGVGAVLVFGEKLPGERRLWWVGMASLLGLLLVWGLVQAPLAYRRWRYQVDDLLLQARYGVVVHEEKVIPISRMQHVDLIRGPFERLFGLATLIVFTAGTDNSSFRVPGLRPERADALRDHILAARGDDVV